MRIKFRTGPRNGRGPAGKFATFTCTTAQRTRRSDCGGKRKTGTTLISSIFFMLCARIGFLFVFLAVRSGTTTLCRRRLCVCARVQSVRIRATLAV